MSNLTLLIPAKHESESLPIFLEELKKFNHKKLIILDEKDIKTVESIKPFDDVEILYQKKTGYGNALIEGINYAKTDFFCIINADGSMDPKYLPEMRKLCDTKDFVFASRYQKPNGGFIFRINQGAESLGISLGYAF